MKVAEASLNYYRMSPRKVRIVANILKKLPVKEAERKLLFLNKKSAKDILKLLKSAVSNAKNKGYDENKLYIENVIINEGPKRKKYYPKARGQVGLITKRTSHILIELGVKNGT